MTVKEMKKLITDLPDDVEIEINSICDDGDGIKLSPVCEAHYCNLRNKVCITPIVISI